MKKIIVNLSAKPRIIDRWLVYEHKKFGCFEFDLSRVKLFTTSEQRNETIGGFELWRKLDSKNTANINLMDFLLKNPYLIPERWKGKTIFFWGTTYYQAVRYSSGRPFVPALSWINDNWYWHFWNLEGAWNSNCPAVVLHN